MARNDLLAGFQAGMQLGQTYIQSQWHADAQARQEEQDARNNALLELKNPGLSIAQNVKGTDGRPDALRARAVTPGTENDEVRPLGGGMLYDTTEANRVDDALAERERKQRMATIEAEYRMRKPHDEEKEDRADKRQRSYFDYTHGITNKTELDMLQKKAEIARSAGDEAAAREYENQSKLLEKRASLFPNNVEGKQTNAKIRILESVMKGYQTAHDKALAEGDEDAADEAAIKLSAANESLSNEMVNAGMINPEIIAKAGSQLSEKKAEKKYQEDLAAYEGKWFKGFRGLKAPKKPSSLRASNGFDMQDESNSSGSEVPAAADPNAIRAMYRAGKITKDEARRQLQGLGGGE